MSDEAALPILYDDEKRDQIVQILVGLARERKERDPTAQVSESMIKFCYGEIVAAALQCFNLPEMPRTEHRDALEKVRKSAHEFREALDELELDPWLSLSVGDLGSDRQLLKRAQIDADEIQALAVKAIDEVPLKGRLPQKELARFVTRLADIFENLSGLPAAVKHVRQPETYCGPFFDLLKAADPVLRQSEEALGKAAQRALKQRT